MAFSNGMLGLQYRHGTPGRKVILLVEQAVPSNAGNQAMLSLGLAEARATSDPVIGQLIFRGVTQASASNPGVHVLYRVDFSIPELEQHLLQAKGTAVRGRVNGYEQLAFERDASVLEQQHFDASERLQVRPALSREEMLGTQTAHASIAFPYMFQRWYAQRGYVVPSVDDFSS